MQRTRSSPSALREPLTRCPLGHPKLHGRWSLGVVLLVCSILPTGCGTTKSIGPDDLSGQWSGTAKTLQVGKCATGPSRATAGKESQATVQLRVKVETDGHFVAWERYGDHPDFDSEPDWSGTVNGLHLTGVRTSEAECRGEKVVAETQIAGNFKSGSSGPTLRVTGREETCPSMKCVFDLVYQLRRQP